MLNIFQMAVLFRLDEIQKLSFQRNLPDLIAELYGFFFVIQKRVVDVKTQNTLDFIKRKPDLLFSIAL